MGTHSPLARYWRQSSSAAIFAFPYGPTPSSRSSSRSGWWSGMPYTAVEETCTKRRTPRACAVSITILVPSMSVVRMSRSE